MGVSRNITIIVYSEIETSFMLTEKFLVGFWISSRSTSINTFYEDDTDNDILPKAIRFDELETLKPIYIYDEAAKTALEPIEKLDLRDQPEELIKIIHVSPTAPEWFFELVKKVVQEDYKLNIEVKQSILYKNQIY